MEYEAWKATWKAPLNPQQEAAVQAAQGPVLLLAVPGSGKTTVLIHRLGYLIFCLGVAPEQILTVTYTVAATRDMAARFARTFGETCGQPAGVSHHQRPVQPGSSSTTSG